MKARKSQRTEENLEAVARHVAFEFKMFREGYVRMRASFIGSSLGIGHNSTAAELPLFRVSVRTPTARSTHTAPMYPGDETGGFHNLEGTLVHFRNLLEFFFTAAPEKDNLILAHHFVGDPAKPPQWAKQYMIRCNNLLSHLTYERVNYHANDSHHWPDILDKCELLDDEIDRFLDSLPLNRRQWFK